MTDELIKLLKEIHAANKCGECDEKGMTLERNGCSRPYEIGMQFGSGAVGTCPYCHGTGAKVAALNRTEWVYHTIETVRGQYGKVLRSEAKNILSTHVLPAPTTDEVLEMLPAEVQTEDGFINSLRLERVRKYNKDGSGFYFLWDARYHSEIFIHPNFVLIQDKSPLMAALKLLLEALQQGWIK